MMINHFIAIATKIPIKISVILKENNGGLNIFEIPSDEIKDVQCVRTVLGGRTIFAR